MHDRVLNGLIAGFVAAAFTKAWSLSSYYLLHFSKFRLLDWLGSAVFGHPPRGIGQTTVAFVLVWMWLSVMGIGLAYLLPLMDTRRGYLLKGWLYGVLLVFATLVLTRLMRTPFVTPTAWQTIVTDLISASIYGLVGAYVLRKLGDPLASD